MRVVESMVYLAVTGATIESPSRRDSSTRAVLLHPRRTGQPAPRVPACGSAARTCGQDTDELPRSVPCGSEFRHWPRRS